MTQIQKKLRKVAAANARYGVTDVDTDMDAIGLAETSLVDVAAPFPSMLPLDPISRRPMQLPEATVQFALTLAPPQSLATSVSDDKALPYASIIIVTYNNLVFTRLCLTSVLASTIYPNSEIIVVDNGSTDDTITYLHQLTQLYGHVRILRNDNNRGFAFANNQGLMMARGDVLVLLNNDTIVPPGWLADLLKHLEDPTVGVVGPVTNRICNEAQIDVPYHTYGEFVQFAQEYTQAHAGELFEIRMLAMFCMAMRWDVFKRVGPIDERFEVGMLEDEDYSMRVRAAGYRVVCAEDAFVHHFSQASFGTLIPSGEFQRLYDTNRQRFEDKWNVRWEPYQHRPNQQYAELVQRIRGVVADVVPHGATVLMVSKGDDMLLQLDGRYGWHFPQQGDGRYSGHHPADSAEAIAHLEALRAKGADYLVFPSIASWWLDYYSDFRCYLERYYRVVAHEDNGCLIFALHEPADYTPLGCD